MRKLVLFSGCLALAPFYASAQCGETNLSGNQVITEDVFMSGTYYVSGDFTIAPGVTVYVTPYGSGQCGKLEIHATNISIQGTINGDYAGFTGGNPGNGAVAVNSITGDQNGLNDCSNKDNAGRIEVEGGFAGTIGLGSGGGLPGQNGGSASGPKQKCESTSDTYGMIPGSGGAGAGGGGSYGGAGTAGLSGGSGSGQHTGTGAGVSPQYPILAGAGGNGGASGSVYGTELGEDIDLGSGGAGSGGGGRSFDSGLPGLRGGHGGGAVALYATNLLTVTGTISVNGEDGKNGGQGGSGGATPKCCSDGCNDCGEATFSAGAGGGSGSGAGSGGGILLKSQGTATITGVLSAQGGNGGNSATGGSGASCTYSNLICGNQNISTGSGTQGGQGGSGGGGRVKVIVPVCATSEITPDYSVAGGTNAGEGSYAEICSQVGLNENENWAVSVFPNPVQDELRIRLTGQDYWDGTIRMLDVSGKLVFQDQLNSDELKVDMRFFQQGVYILQMEVNGISGIRKIVKQ